MRIKRWKELLTGIALVGAITPAISISVNKKIQLKQQLYNGAIVIWIILFKL